MKKQIVFLEPFPEVMIYKMAMLFKKKGYETISLRVLESKDSSLTNFYKKAFDKTESFNLSFFKMDFKNLPLIFMSLLKKFKKILQALIFTLKLKPYVIIARAKPSWPCALMRIVFKNTPFIYFPYDIRSVDCKSFDIAKQKGLKNFEINAEKFCFEKADGIIHKGDPNELNFLEGRIFDKIDFTPLQLSFLPYCSKEFVVPFNKNKLSKKDKEIHIVQVSSIGSVNVKECSFLFDYFKAAEKNKVHFHIYLKPNTLSKEELIKSFKKYYKKETKGRYFHIHEPKNPQELIKEISQFDFGIFLLPPYNKKNVPLEIKTGLGNKQASYFEAGLPFFYPKEVDCLDRIMAGYKLRFPLEGKEDIRNMKKEIKSIDYKKLERKIKAAREDFSMEKHFPELEEFVKKVVNKKR